MKKLTAILLAAALLLTVIGAVAETTINGTENRGITPAAVGTNECEDGISPTTGLALSDYDVPATYAGLAVTGKYQPMLVQIDNTNGGVEDCAPWGASYADIVYESPLHRNGNTRMSFLFSDVIPDSVGPVRSARVGHVYLRAEWDAGFLYYGGQERDGSNIKDAFRITNCWTGADPTSTKTVLFSGTDGKNKPWKEYYTAREHVKAPHNKDANVAAMSELIGSDVVAEMRPYIFTDEIPEGDSGEDIKVYWYTDYDSELQYDWDSNVYFRYIIQDGELVPYEDRDSGEQLSFANVIIQYTTVTYNGASDAPVTQHVGEGNADIFQGGVHIAGYWKREDTVVGKQGDDDYEYNAGRTVFYDADGNEIAMQRGKTLIEIVPLDATVTYE